MYNTILTMTCYRRYDGVKKKKKNRMVILESCWWETLRRRHLTIKVRVLERIEIGDRQPCAHGHALFVHRKFYLKASRYKHPDTTNSSSNRVNEQKVEEEVRVAIRCVYWEQRNDMS